MDEKELLKQFLERYEREYDRYLKLVQQVRRICEHEILTKHAIRGSVQSRVKSLESLKNKAVKKIARQAKESESFKSVEALFQSVDDIAAVRVTTYIESDRSRVVDHIQELFVCDGPVIKDDKNRSFYRATHCQVKLDEEDISDSGPNWNLKNMTCEIQVCSMLAHVWNEIEHDIAYKPEGAPPGKLEGTHLSLLGNLTEHGDTIIESLISVVATRGQAEQEPFVDVYDFVARLRNILPNVKSIEKNAGELFDEMVDSDLSSLKSILGAFPDWTAFEGTRNQFAKYIREQLENEDPDKSKRKYLDFDTSDFILVPFLDKFSADVICRNPTGRGEGRPNRLVWLAKMFQKFKTTETK